VPNVGAAAPRGGGGNGGGSSGGGGGGGGGGFRAPIPRKVPPGDAYIPSASLAAFPDVAAATVACGCRAGAPGAPCDDVWAALGVREHVTLQVLFAPLADLAADRAGGGGEGGPHGGVYMRLLVRYLLSVEAKLSADE